jgi:tetratricopeptide (TPR) repeat protein
MAREPLAGLVFISVPEHLRPLIAPTIDPDLPIPCETSAGQPGKGAVTIEAIIAGMLRVIIYRPDHEHAETYKMIVRELRPSIKEEFTEAGRIKAELKDFPVAIEIFRALTALFPDCAVCGFNLALVYHDAAEYVKTRPEETAVYEEEAFRAYRAALPHADALPDIHVNYGYFLLERENYEKALAHFEAYLGLEKDPKKRAPIEKIASGLAVYRRQDGLFKEAFDCISLGKEEEGLAKAMALLQDRPEFWNGWFLKGWAERRLGRYTEAKNSFRQALSLSPRSQPDILNELAIACMELGELDESYRWLVEAIRLEPENTKILSNLGVVCLKMDRPDEAAGFFRTVLEYAPGDPLAENYLEILEKK